MRGRAIPYNQRHLAFIKHRRKMPRRELHAAFIRRFPRLRYVKVDSIKQLCLRKGWLTGRDGCYPKGHEPANKGKTMPYHPNSARTRFKKGDRTGRANQIYKPIGTERLSKDGYRERKVHDGLPMQSRWRAIHLINWEKRHGPIPKGHCLKCQDGNKLNVKASNWTLISRGDLAARNSRFRGVKVPPELEAAAMSVTKLARQLRKAEPRA